MKLANLTLPSDIVTQRMGLLGRSGKGKAKLRTADLIVLVFSLESKA